jgi:tetratricopeptide (TPR) repeat protein
LLGFLAIQTGNNVKAVHLIKKAIQSNGTSAKYYANLAVALQNLRRNEEAISACFKAIELQPDNFNAFNTLGNAFLGVGDSEQAIKSFRKAISINPDIAEVHLNLGKALRGLGILSEAEECFKTAIALRTDYAEAYLNLGILYRSHGNLDKAVANLLQAVKSKPEFAEAYNILGNVLVEQDKLDAAVACYQQALQTKPGYAEAYFNLGNAFAEKENFDEAVTNYQLALTFKPAFAPVYCKLGNALLKQEKLDEAAASYQHALTIKPDFADAYNGLGNVLREQGKPEESIETYRKALLIKPDFAEVHCNISNALFDQGRLDEAIESCYRSLAIKPDLAEAHWIMALALLTKGNFAQGWKKYEWRFLKKDADPPPFPWPCWDGSSLSGKTLLVYAEQGIGDEIMFSSCLQEIIDAADLCIVECDKRLIPLFSRSFPEARFLARIVTGHSPSTELPPADIKVAIGSLPLFLRPDLASFPQLKAYLSPDVQKVNRWREKYKTLGEGLKIGISWRGGKGYVRRIRSTMLTQWADLFSIPEIHFVNLQYGHCAVELEEIKEKSGTTVHHWEDADPLKDLDGFAAKIAALDLVISVDNSTVHMAGALGVPVWTLLPFNCDWRWMKDWEDTPWYTSVRLFRKKRHGDWKEVFERVSSNLKQYLQTGGISKIDPQNSYKTPNPVLSELYAPFSPLIRSSSERTYRCAVVTPVGPGHEAFYEHCLASIEKSFKGNRGRFSEIIPIKIDDTEGENGRSKARNMGVMQAAEQGIEWIFFLDADDLIVPSAFKYVSPYLDNYDGIWGSIWSIEQGEKIAKERPGQLPFLYSIHDVLSCDPFVTLQMGHFIKTPIALSTPFDETLDAGEDFDYYMHVWERHNCIKIPLPLFYNRRGHRSQGVRSATGAAWRQIVENILKRYRQGKATTFSQ